MESARVQVGSSEGSGIDCRAWQRRSGSEAGQAGLLVLLSLSLVSLYFYGGKERLQALLGRDLSADTEFKFVVGLGVFAVGSCVYWLYLRMIGARSPFIMRRFIKGEVLRIEAIIEATERETAQHDELAQKMAKVMTPDALSALQEIHSIVDALRARVVFARQCIERGSHSALVRVYLDLRDDLVLNPDATEELVKCDPQPDLPSEMYEGEIERLLQIITSEIERKSLEPFGAGRENSRALANGSHVNGADLNGSHLISEDAAASEESYREDTVSDSDKNVSGSNAQSEKSVPSALESNFQSAASSE